MCGIAGIVDVESQLCPDLPAHIKRMNRLQSHRGPDKDEIKWEHLGEIERFSAAFNSVNVESKSYFDSMSHFDFKTLLPALLHVEDRMSMAHGLESRVPFLDHPIVEFAATMPANVKFRDGTLKKVLLYAMREVVPAAVSERQDKRGFPVPLNEWLRGELKDFFHDVFSCQSARTRPYFNSNEILKSMNSVQQFGRKLWGLLCLELRHQEFLDKAHLFRRMEAEPHENSIPLELSGIQGPI